MATNDQLHYTELKKLQTCQLRSRKLVLSLDLDLIQDSILHCSIHDAHNCCKLVALWQWLSTHLPQRLDKSCVDLPKLPRSVFVLCDIRAKADEKLVVYNMNNRKELAVELYKSLVPVHNLEPSLGMTFQPRSELV